MINYKKDFPIFENQKIVYLDSAATSQKPKFVIKAVTDFYENSNANIHRGIYKLSENATKKYEEARAQIARFINANPNEVIFTSGTTDGINKLANSLTTIFKNKNEIILTELEHHSNIVPWQEAAKRHNMKILYVKITPNYELDYNNLKKLINKKTAIVSITHISNALGTRNDIKKIVKLAHKHKALVILDAAQSVPRIKVDVKKLGVDFMVFSGHKAYGPMGIGVIYGKKELLDKIPPFSFGGDMIDRVSKEGSTYSKEIRKFEAGTQNIAGAIGLAEAIKYLKKIKIINIEKYEKKLIKYLLKKIEKIEKIEIYNSMKNTAGILSFNIKGIHSHDIASLLDDYNIAIRAGHHCTMPLMKKLKISGTARVSFYFYNTKEDIDKFVKALKEIIERFN